MKVALTLTIILIVTPLVLAAGQASPASVTRGMLAMEHTISGYAADLPDDALTPSAGNAGTVVVVAGMSFFANDIYAIQIGGPTGEITYGTFKALPPYGEVPSGTNFTFPAMPSDQTLTGTQICISSSTACELGVSVPIDFLDTNTSIQSFSVATFTLQAKLTLGTTISTPGQTTSFTATGLVHGQAYNIIWGAGVSINGITQGTVVGSFTASSSDGSATGSFTVPSSASGTYTLQLLRTSDILGTTQSGVTTVFKLNASPTITVVQTTRALGTGTLALIGSLTQIPLNAFPMLSATYMNNLNSSLIGIVFAVVHNKEGQTVYYTTATISPAAGATTTAYLALAGLPSGSYSVTVFVVSTNGAAISQSSNAFISL